MTDNTQKAQAAGEIASALDQALYLAVCTLAFHGRDRGTDRQEKMLDGLEELALKADPVIRNAISILSQPPEASEGEVVAYLKFWWNDQRPCTRVDLTDICEPWLAALKPTITPLYAHPPKPEASALREAIGIALACTPQVRDGKIIYDCGDPWEILRTALAHPRPGGEA